MSPTLELASTAAAMAGLDPANFLPLRDHDSGMAASKPAMTMWDGSRRAMDVDRQ